MERSGVTEIPYYLVSVERPRSAMGIVDSILQSPAQFQNQQYTLFQNHEFRIPGCLMEDWSNHWCVKGTFAILE